MNMISMKRAAEKKDDCAEPALDNELYPYGLSISLGVDEMTKLGMKEMPKVGTKMMIACAVEVCDISISQSTGGEEYKNLRLQITDMGIESKAKTMDEIAAGLYGKKG